MEQEKKSPNGGAQFLLQVHPRSGPIPACPVVRVKGDGLGRAARSGQKTDGQGRCHSTLSSSNPCGRGGSQAPLPGWPFLQWGPSSLSLGSQWVVGARCDLSWRAIDRAICVSDFRRFNKEWKREKISKRSRRPWDDGFAIARGKNLEAYLFLARCLKQEAGKWSGPLRTDLLHVRRSIHRIDTSLCLDGSFEKTVLPTRDGQESLDN